MVARPDNSVVPSEECVLDVVGGCVDENAVLVPGGGLDPSVLVHHAQRLQVAVAYDHLVLGEQGHVAHVLGPHHIPERMSRSKYV